MKTFVIFLNKQSKYFRNL